MSKIGNLKPVIVIDVGTDQTKYSQSYISTYTVSNIIKEKTLNKKHIKKTSFNIQNLKENYFIDKTDNPDLAFDTETPTDDPDYIIQKEEVTPDDNTNVDSEDLFKVNPNTIFDCDFYVKSFPTLLSCIPINADKESILDFKSLYDYYTISSLLDKIKETDQSINYLYDFNYQKPDFDLNSTKFSFETIHSGIINNYEGWKKVIDGIGQTELSSSYNSNYLSDTPIIITQNSLSFNQLQKQVRMQYEILFEDFNVPFSIVCSQALTCLFSFNELTGVVVDIGESGTGISVIVNGFTQYDNSMYIPFISGRNITAMIAMSRKSKIDLNHNLNYREFIEAKFIKENFKKDDECLINQNSLTKVFNTEVNIYDATISKFLLFFPEIFKSTINKAILNGDKWKDKKANFFKGYFNNVRDYFSTNLETPFESGTRGFGDYQNSTIFNEKVISLYRDFDSLEKEILISETSVDINAIQKSFRTLGLAHSISKVMHKAKLANPDYYKQLNNIYFTGGVLKTPNIKELIIDDITSCNGKGIPPSLFFPEKDPSTTFYKGVNYFSKLPDLDRLLISKKDYFENGSEQLSYNYI